MAIITFWRGYTLKKLLLYAGMSMLCAAAWVMGGCANGSSGNAQNNALLLGLNKMTEEEAAFSIMTALPTAQETMQSSGGSKSVLSTKDMIAEISKKASSAFLKSELRAPGARQSVSLVVDASCEKGTCYTLSGTGACANGGTMTFNDLKMSLDMVYDEPRVSLSGAMDGSITYANCGGKCHSWLTYPDYVETVIDGTIAQNDQTDGTSIVLAGDILSGSYTMSRDTKGSRTVTAETVIVNGMKYTQVQLNCTTDLTETSQVSNQVYVTDGNIITVSGDYFETITGHVTIEGTLGPDNDVNAERIFNAETFRYHSSCRMDSENFSVSCSITKM
jgi:hypothetical protein